MGEFSAGSVIGRSFSIWIKNFVPFTLLSLVVFSPMLIWVIVLTSGDLTLKKITTFGLYATPLTMVLSLVATGAMTYGVFQQLRGQHASIGKCIGVGLGRLFPILGVGILTGLCIMVGVLGLIVGAFIVMCMLWVAVPVAVVERPGVFASLSRSAELTKGSKGSIFGIILILGVINWVISFVLQKATIGTDPTMSDLKVYLILSIVESAVFGALSAVTNAVGYHDLRVSKEGVNAEELSKVFD